MHQVSSSPRTFFPDGMKYQATAFHEPGAEGWGDEIPHYYVVEDMLKLDPGQVMYLRENAPLKGMVQAFLQALGSGGWFENNGETFGQTLEWVARERGDVIEDLRDAVEEGELGIVRSEV